MAEEGFLDPTPIQRQAITALLQQRELLAVAPTGSGKTLAFLIPLVLKIRQLKRLEQQIDTEKIEEVVPTTRKSKRNIKPPKEDTPPPPASPPPPTIIKGGGLKALVISPTKELSTQSARVLVPLLPGIKVRASVLSRATAAGTDFSHVDILFANPLRLGAMSREGKIDLSTVEYLILDEADKLFDMGFAEQIDTVIAACTHKNITKGLFSATLPDTVEMLARNVLGDPLRITVGERGAAAACIEQKLLFVGRESGRLLGLRQIISQGIKPPVLVFVSTKERAQELRRDLMYDGVHIDCIHSDQPQAARVAAIDNFRLGKTWILIATDLLGRGMDFAGVNTVVNYDFPHNTTDYVHRIGRTGRAGRKGMAVTFFAEEDVGKLRGVANIMRGAGCQVPEWMLQLKKQRKNRRRKDVEEGDVEEDKKETGDGKKRKMMVKSRKVYGGRVTSSKQKQKPKKQNKNKA
jgi:ATP-dependent RNA helicase DDX52/ROK1